jgi:hypothetical protein
MSDNDPQPRHELSLTILKMDISYDDLVNAVGEQYAEIFYLLERANHTIRSYRLDPGQLSLSPEEIAKSLQKRLRHQPGGASHVDKAFVDRGLLALQDAGLIQLLYLGKQGEFDAG